ncbi:MULTISPECIES: arsenate reductase ArsC [unclassified Leisingera]|uniref:arsenate reductase ArsC n=1 Tax=unclassified Leisingera TaxID=2614906 RepID=UPI00057E543D|nr:MULTISPECIES: arsenate reductase ArsC [unclassified Leisingera]KIC19347.1 arsenate reductase [Leisingera sp. ANG-DT]KIC27349.1 arsenate reductase [Leisingera sp. ANG-M6]KIC33736.1 arsenate reductase [Leisingera sp. ANG-S5]
MNILVLCTGNSARSILLESIFNTLGAGRTRAYSAGSNPTGKVHPQSLVLLNELGHDVSGARSKSWDEFAEADAPEMDIVITVCASAAGETCPIWPGAPVRAHWGVEDPAAADQPEWDKAFRTAYITLEKRAKALLELPFEDMKPAELSEQLKRIGEIV